MGALSSETELSFNHKGIIIGYASFELPLAVRRTGEGGYTQELVGSRNVIYPDWIGRAGLSIRSDVLPMQVASQASLVGPRTASEMNIREHGEVYRLPAYGLVDVSLGTAGVRFLSRNRETTLMIKVSNLLGRRGPDPGFAGVDYPLPGRNVMFQLRQEL